jgi:hypothetical protein
VELKRSITKRGFKIGSIVIPPEKSDVQGFIPDVPHYMGKEDVVGILSRYGQVVAGDFKKFEDTEIRCGGFKFELDLHPNQKLPGSIQILTDTLILKLKDDIMVCVYCDKIGHTQRFCRKKLADNMNRANLELQEQTETVEVEMQDENVADGEEFEDNNQQRHSSDSNVQTPPPQAEVPATATTAIVAKPPVGTPPPPSPALTPIHPAPKVAASNMSNITPGQGTPSTSPPVTIEALNKINPIYPSRKGPQYDKTYEELEEILNNQIRICTDSKTNEILCYKRNKTEGLTEEEEARAKKMAWQSTIENMKYLYDKEHGQYTPFMEEREKRLQAARKT